MPAASLHWDVGFEIGSTVVRLQVKSTNVVYREKGNAPAYRFAQYKGRKRVAYQQCDYDILALVNIADKKIVYLTDYHSKTSFKIRCSEFNKSCNSLESAIYDLHQGKS